VKTILRTRSNFLLLLSLCFILVSNNLYGYPNGATGTTLKTSTSGCSCHNSSPSSSVAVTISGPDTVIIDQSNSYTVTVTGGSGTTGGVDIAVSRGSLTPVSSFLKLSNGELTHNKRVSVPSTYNFTYQAPALAGSDTLYATGKGANFSAWNWASNKRIIVRLANDVVKEKSVPAQYDLKQNYPNPFNPSTLIQYSLPHAAAVVIKIYDVTGKEVASLMNGFKPSGEHTVQWDGSSVPSGIYLYRIVADEYTETKKLILMK
jgi:hypothetical protein